MQIIFNKALFIIALLGSTIFYLMSSSYGMQIEEVSTKGRGKEFIKTPHVRSLTSFPAIERKLKGRNDSEYMELKLRQVVQSLSSHAPRREYINNYIKILWEEATKKGNFAGCYNMGWISQPDGEQEFIEASIKKIMNFASINKKGKLLEDHEVFYWLQRAHQPDAMMAWCIRGVLYLSEEGIREDFAEAKKWFQKAALRNNSWGNMGMGFLACAEAKEKKDYTIPMQWFQKAADQDDSWAQILLGFIAFSGNEEKPPDLIEATQWLRKSAENNNTWGQTLFYMYKLGDRTEAVQWLHKAANQNNPKAHFLLAVAYHSGEFGRQDRIEAEQWWKKRAEADTSLSLMIGDLCMNTEGLQEEAIEWYLKAGKQINSERKYRVGLYCLAKESTRISSQLYSLNKVKIDRDYQKAFEWLHQALSELKGDEFEHMSLTDAEASQVASLLSKVQHLTNINLSFNKFTSQGLKDILQCLESFPTLEELDLSDNEIDDKGGKELLIFFAQHPSLQTLWINGNPMSQGMQKSIEECKKNSS